MKRLHAVLRRVHAISTHQRFAVDALSRVRSDAGRRLVEWLIYHHRDYMRGAIDPDIRFRDFHNHILHVQDGYWGGGPRVAHQWYDRLQGYLREERFREAAHATGVLSHYITDMTQPLHTISNDREALIHRPFEWSVEASYSQIARRSTDQGMRVAITLSRAPGWLGSLMMHLATRSNRHSAALAKRYRFGEGVSDPPSGLDDWSREVLAELFTIAIDSIASVIDRAAADVEAETGDPIAHCHTGLAWISACLTTPISLWRRQARKRCESRAVRELAEEYYRTGRLEEHLPPEVDIKRRVIEVYQADNARSCRRLAA